LGGRGIVVGCGEGGEESSSSPSSGEEVVILFVGLSSFGGSEADSFVDVWVWCIRLRNATARGQPESLTAFAEKMVC
jgi:hypothetical protein